MPAEIQVVFTFVQGVLTVLSVIWPFDAAETVKLVIELSTLLYAALGTRDWSKVRNFVRDTCVEVEDKVMTNEEKVAYVVDKAWRFMPKKVKVLPWVTKELVTNLVISQYATFVKPKMRLNQPSTEQSHVEEPVTTQEVTLPEVDPNPTEISVEVPLEINNEEIKVTIPIVGIF